VPAGQRHRPGDKIRLSLILSGGGMAMRGPAEIGHVVISVEHREWMIKYGM